MNAHDEIEERITALVDASDLDDLIRLVDSLCSSRDWAHVLRTRDACRSAVRTGRQVWPIATLCEYRLALHAPAEWAHRVVDDEASRFSIGPLTEVIAQNHSWSELRGLLPFGPQRDLIAHERIIRGDRVGREDVTGDVLDIPTDVFDWEPQYPLAMYSDDGIRADAPYDDWTHDWFEAAAANGPVTEVDDEETESALRSLVEPWTSASSGRARCIVVEGDLGTLAAALGRQSIRASALTPHQALQWLAWCGASSGSHGRRRGAAAGRFNTWWIAAALSGSTARWDEWRDIGALPRELGSSIGRLEWYRIEGTERHSYELNLVAVDCEEELAIGLLAHDDPI
jgi:hypothetical protein